MRVARFTEKRICVPTHRVFFARTQQRRCDREHRRVDDNCSKGVRNMQRLLPPLLLVLTWIAMILLSLVVPIAKPFPDTVRLIGGAFAALGLVLSVIGSRTFKNLGTNIMTFDKPDKLVTTGPFAYSRNPMYLGFAICALGGAVALGSAAALLVAVLFSITLDRWYVQFEEAMMRNTFGADFEAYCSRVRRWL